MENNHKWVDFEWTVKMTTSRELFFLIFPAYGLMDVYEKNLTEINS